KPCISRLVGNEVQAPTGLRPYAAAYGSGAREEVCGRQHSHASITIPIERRNYATSCPKAEVVIRRVGEPDDHMVEQGVHKTFPSGSFLSRQFPICSVATAAKQP